MFKLFVMLGVIILFNILSRKIGNLDKDLEKDNLASNNDNLDDVWANLAKLAEEKKRAANLAEEEVAFSNVSLEQEIVDNVGVDNISKQDQYFQQTPFSDISSFSDVSEFRDNISDNGQGEDLPEDVNVLDMLEEEDRCLPSVHDQGVNNHDFLKNSFEIHQDDMLGEKDLEQEDVIEKKDFIFSSNPVVNGIIFSEILGKSKGKR